MADAVPSPESEEGEERRVYVNRKREALEAGLTMGEAEIFAVNGIDVGQLRACVRAHLEPDDIAAIVV